MGRRRFDSKNLPIDSIGDVFSGRGVARAGVRQEILSLRRASFAVFVALVTLVVSGGAIGFAAAASERGTPEGPREFSVAAPHIGDAGTYSAFEYRPAGDEWV